MAKFECTLQGDYDQALRYFHDEMSLTKSALPLGVSMVPASSRTVTNPAA